MSESMDQFGLPAGRYDAKLEVVELERNGKGGAWHLDLISRVQKNGKRAIETRKLGKSGAYDLSDAQRKSLRALAKRIGAQDFGPPEEIVASIKQLVGATFTAHVRPSPLGGVATTLYRQNGHEGVSGDVLDRMPSVEPEYTQKTINAQGAHEQFLTGIRHANRGLALAAQAAHRLRLDEGWTALGYDSLGQYLADPDIAMSRSQFYALADIWEQYVEQGGVDELRLCAPSKLEVPLPALKAGDVTVEEAIDDAETLGLRDLRAKYRGERDASEKPERPPSFPFGCKHCGSFIESMEDVVERHPDEA